MTNLFFERNHEMAKLTLALFTTTTTTTIAIAVAGISTAAQAAPLARVGVGQVYSNVASCAANSATYTPSEAAMAYARAHPSKGTPVYGANATGTVCVLMHTSVPGKAEDGQRQGDHWVRVPKKFVYQAANGGMIYYTLCNNPISQVQEQAAVQMSEAPCTDCAPTPAAPARQTAMVSYTQEAAVSYEAPQRVAYQGAPVQFSLPGQSIGQGLFPQSVAVAVSNVTYNTNTSHFTLPGATTPTPPFGGTTMPPAGNGFGGTTQPPAGNGFGGQTQPPAPVPGPQPVGSPMFGGATASPVPAPVNNGGFNNGGYYGSGSRWRSRSCTRTKQRKFWLSKQ
jgi:hypothetical protein